MDLSPHCALCAITAIKDLVRVAGRRRGPPPWTSGAGCGRRQAAEPAVWDTGERVGAWRSLVARTVRVGEVPSSNLGAPISGRSAESREYGRKARKLVEG